MKKFILGTSTLGVCDVVREHPQAAVGALLRQLCMKNSLLVLPQGSQHGPYGRLWVLPDYVTDTKKTGAKNKVFQAFSLKSKKVFQSSK